MSIRKEDFFLRCETLREYEDMRAGANQSGDPGGMNQGQHQHFRKNSRVIGMTHVTERTGSDHSQAGGIHYLDVPVLTERTDNPPANCVGRKKNGEANGGKNGNKWAVKK